MTCHKCLQKCLFTCFNRDQILKCQKLTKITKSNKDVALWALRHPNPMRGRRWLVVTQVFFVVQVLPESGAHTLQLGDVVADLFDGVHLFLQVVGFQEVSQLGTLTWSIISFDNQNKTMSTYVTNFQVSNNCVAIWEKHGNCKRKKKFG